MGPPDRIKAVFPWQFFVGSPTKSLQELPYPADAGSTCEAWDAKNHPDCKGDKAAAWCKKARLGLDGWVGRRDVFFAIFWGC